MKKIVRIICLLLAAVLSFSLAACGGGSDGTSSSPVISVNGDYVLKYGDLVLDESDYLYLAAMMKDYFVYYLYQMSGGQVADESALFALPYGDSGKTMGDYISERVLEIAQQMVIVEKLCADAGVAITDQTVLDNLQQRIDDLEYAYGGEDLFDIALTRMGLTKSAVTRYDRFSELYELYSDYRYGAGGTAPIAESAVKDYFNENFIKYDGAVFSYLDDDGSNLSFNYGETEIKDYFYDNYVKIAHILYKTDDKNTDEQNAEIEAKANATFESIKSGEKTHAELIEENEDGRYEYVFTYGEMVEEFETASFEMEVGEVRLVKTQFGYHIMLKSALEDTDLYGTTDEDGKTSGGVSSEVVTAMTQRDIRNLADGVYEQLKNKTISDFPESVDSFGGYEYREPSTIDANNSDYATLINLIKDISDNEFTKTDLTGSGTIILRRLPLNDEDLSQAIYSNIEGLLINDAYIAYIESFYDDVEVNREVLDRFDILTIPSLEDEFYQ